MCQSTILADFPVVRQSLLGRPIDPPACPPRPLRRRGRAQCRAFPARGHPWSQHPQPPAPFHPGRRGSYAVTPVFPPNSSPQKCGARPALVRLRDQRTGRPVPARSPPGLPRFLTSPPGLHTTARRCADVAAPLRIGNTGSCAAPNVTQNVHRATPACRERSAEPLRPSRVHHPLRIRLARLLNLAAFRVVTLAAHQAVREI